jgi:hypothetical protein
MLIKFRQFIANTDDKSNIAIAVLLNKIDLSRLKVTALDNNINNIE